MTRYINIQKDIGEYNEKIIAGLSLRGLAGIGIGGGLALALAAFSVFVLNADVAVVSIPIMLVAVGCYVVSFMKPLGMNAEKAAVLYWNQYFGTTKLTYKSSMGIKLDECIERRREQIQESTKKKKDKYAKNEIKEYRRLRSGRGINCGEILIPATAQAAEAFAPGAEKAEEGSGS